MRVGENNGKQKNGVLVPCSTSPVIFTRRHLKYCAGTLQPQATKYNVLHSTVTCSCSESNIARLILALPVYFISSLGPACPVSFVLLRDLDLHADRAPLGLGYNQVVVVLDVLDGGVVQAGPRQDAQGQGRREEVEFTIGKATDPATVSFAFSFPRERITYSLPRHPRLPFPNDMRCLSSA